MFGDRDCSALTRELLTPFGIWLPRNSVAQARTGAVNMGISREYQQFLFDPYTQANASISRRFGGTGLGLSICKRIAELMHGSLWCESELGKGSTFHLSIPCTPARNVYCPPEHTTSIPMCTNFVKNNLREKRYGIRCS